MKVKRRWRVFFIIESYFKELIEIYIVANELVSAFFVAVSSTEYVNLVVVERDYS